MKSTTEVKILFLHNFAVHYRIKLFSILKERFGSTIEFWFYHDKKKTFPGTYFKHIKILRKPISVSVIFSLIKVKFSILILSGSHSFENIFLFIIAKLRRKPIIFWTETWDWGKKNVESYLFTQIFGVIARNSEVCIYPGVKVKDFYLRMKIPESKMVFAPNASVFENCVSRDVLGVEKQNKVVVGYMARIIERKGLDYLIKAFHCLPHKDYELYIGGQAESKNNDFIIRCRELSKQSNAIKFYGRIREHNTKDFLDHVDIFIYPSINLNGFAEPWGLALNEAVSLGKIVIATDAVASAFDLIKDNVNGFLIRQKNVEQLRDAIIKAKYLDKKAAYDYSIVLGKKYSFENMANGFIEAINKVTV